MEPSEEDTILEAIDIVCWNKSGKGKKSKQKMLILVQFFLPAHLFYLKEQGGKTGRRDVQKMISFAKQPICQLK